MHGDLTRRSFDPSKAYSAVRHQQGRALLDADHNEHVDIQLHDVRTAREHIVGATGAPEADAGFAVTADAAGRLSLGAGTYYVRGVRCTNPAVVDLGAGQPFLPGATPPASTGAYAVYLEVWEQPITALQDPTLREVALGGPDTTTRDRVVWQLRYLRLGDAGAATNCVAANAAVEAVGAAANGTLEAREQPTIADVDPCIVAASMGYRGLENQLYRIEVHEGNVREGDGAPLAIIPTFKFSRENGAIVASLRGRLTGTSNVEIRVDRLGPGGTAGFVVGGWVELTNDDLALRGEPGFLVRVERVGSDTLRLETTDAARVDAILARPNPIVRRWDSDGPRRIDSGGAGGWIRLEDGIEVRFSSGARLRSGDFWLLPARTSVLPGTTRQIDWPAPAAKLPHGHTRRRALLALADFDGTAWSIRAGGDCRSIFPPLTSLTQIAHSGGDGQHGAPQTWLPSPLAVVVSRGNVRVANARVRFRVTTGGGAVRSAAPEVAGASQGTTIDVVTDGQGVARAFFRLGPSTVAVGPVAADAVFEPALAQTVEARRLQSDGTEFGPAIRFAAIARSERQLQFVGGNGQSGRPGETLSVALRVRVAEGHRPVRNAVVEFAVLNTMLNGSPLDQFRGGAVHASETSLVVSQSPWPGGTRLQSVRVRTNDDGIAQVQWALGTERALPTQRIEARLLDAAGAATAQTVLFLARLNLASEVDYAPNVPAFAARIQSAGLNAQNAIDELARMVEELARGSGGTLSPFSNLMWRNANGLLRPVPAGQTIALPEFAAFVFRDDLVRDRSIVPRRHHPGVRVVVDVPNDLDPDRRGSAQPPIPWTHHVPRQLRGTLELRPTIAWVLTPEARGTLPQAHHRTEYPGRILVTPSLLPGAAASDTPQVLEHAFTFTIPYFG